MSLESRYEKFQKVFPKSELTLAEWKVMKHWSEVAPGLLRLDMTIFPDSLKSITWVRSPLNTIMFAPSQTKLAGIFLSYSNVNKVLLPPACTSVTELDLTGTPVTKLGLGGSIDSIESLRITEMLSQRVSLPEGMIKLRTLYVGTEYGKVILPKGAVELQELWVSVGEESVVKIPADYTKLETVLVQGSVSSLKIPNVITSIRKLQLKVNTETCTIPRIEGVVDLSVFSNRLKSVVVPNSLGATLEDVNISCMSADTITLAKSMPALKIAILNSDTADIVIPKSATKLTSINIRSETASIRPELPELKSLWVSATDLSIQQGKTMTELESVYLPCPGDVKVSWPDNLPNLKSIIVGENVDIDKLKYPVGAVVGRNCVVL